MLKQYTGRVGAAVLAIVAVLAIIAMVGCDASNSVVAPAGERSGVASSSVASSSAASSTNTNTNNRIYPNEPAGFSLIYLNDGSEDDIKNDGWTTDNGDGRDWDANVNVVEDDSLAGGSGFVLEVHHPAGTGQVGAGKAILLSWNQLVGVSTGPTEELYVMLKVFMPVDMPHGQKMYYVGVEDAARPGGTTNNMFLTYETNGVGFFSMANGTATQEFRVSDMWVGSEGAWVELELHLVAESANGARDGRVDIWRDGVNVLSQGGVQFADTSEGVGRLFDGFTWYQNSTINSGSDPDHRWYIGELYISGR